MRVPMVVVALALTLLVPNSAPSQTLSLETSHLICAPGDSVTFYGTLSASDVDLYLLGAQSTCPYPVSISPAYSFSNPLPAGTSEYGPVLTVTTEALAPDTLYPIGFGIHFGTDWGAYVGTMWVGCTVYAPGDPAPRPGPDPVPEPVSQSLSLLALVGPAALLARRCIPSRS
ncbi:MAG TPA: hypothetical protein VGN26_11265 [Armatimonadota bacterium]|jgi:hypothetical protein